MIQLDVDVTGEAGHNVDAFLAALRDRRGLHGAIATLAFEVTRAHLRDLNRHETAERLGAAPTGHWEEAAEKTLATFDAESAVVTIAQPGIRRVAGPITISPQSGRYLTIPVIAAAYGRRAGEFADLEFALLGPRRTPALVRPGPAGQAGTVFYLLVEQVTQPQDRSLLPSDEVYRQCALQGTRDYLAVLLGKEAA